VVGGRVLERLADGTVKQRSPITGTVVWTVPGRSNRPLPAALPPSRPLPAGPHDDLCPFCPARIHQTPPERARFLLTDAGGPTDEPWVVRRDLGARHAAASPWDVRRFPNLFAILPFSYWQANHGVELPVEALDRAARYGWEPEGRAHLLAIARARLRAAGVGAQLADQEPQEALLASSTAFFASTHDVVTARRHVLDGATMDDQLASAGDLTVEEHHAFVACAIDGLADLCEHVPGARNVAVFQNWLRPAGASFDHLHKQVVAIDEHGPLLDRVLELLRDDPRLFTTAVVDPASRDRLLIAQNDHALALAGVGHRYPTVEVLTTGPAVRPQEAPPAVVRGVSDLLHACHAATGRLVPTNEEWHVAPPGVGVPMPWRINLKWRISTLAGFEGGTKINVNTISPFELRERLVGALARLRDEGRIAPMRLGDECDHGPGLLHYAD
jgi:galactose-1-phosphate uridylyltransferase